MGRRGPRTALPQRSRGERLGLFEAFRPLARQISTAFLRRCPAWTDKDAIHAHALIGLWKATGSWTAAGGMQFPGYASLRIRGTIVDRLREDTQYRRKNKERGSPAVFSEMGLDDNFGGQIADHRADLPHGALASADEFRWLRRQMSWRSRLVLVLHYAEGFTLQEIGGFLGYGESRMWQLHQRILAFLRQRLRRVGCS